MIYTSNLEGFIILVDIEATSWQTPEPIGLEVIGHISHIAAFDLSKNH